MIFDQTKLSELIRARDKAIEQDLDSFYFDHNVLLVSYAKYLIEYLEGKLNERQNHT